MSHPFAPLSEPSRDDLPMWVIYDHPSDFPEHIVVRLWRVVRGNPEPVTDSRVKLYDTLEQARGDLPPGVYNIGRHESDEPNIIEVWL